VHIPGVADDHSRDIGRSQLAKVLFTTLFDVASNSHHRGAPALDALQRTDMVQYCHQGISNGQVNL